VTHSYSDFAARSDYALMKYGFAQDTAQPLLAGADHIAHFQDADDSLYGTDKETMSNHHSGLGCCKSVLLGHIAVKLQQRLEARKSAGPRVAYCFLANAKSAIPNDLLSHKIAVFVAENNQNLQSGRELQRLQGILTGFPTSEEEDMLLLQGAPCLSLSSLVCIVLYGH
jgi:hypothetical protein